ncbi:MAG: hypothetical protein HYY04_11675 [Chloroflexi bacterium]|nr:hypothetical protein [Chloroflexota bacterium]
MDAPGRRGAITGVLSYRRGGEPCVRPARGYQCRLYNVTPDWDKGSGRHVRDARITPPDIARLERFADWEWLPVDVPTDRTGLYQAAVDDSEATARLTAALPRAEALVICTGSPRITAAVMDAGPRLRLIGEMEGDRFAARIDTQAAWERGIRVVDTTNATSYPVAEWALAMMLIALRNAGEHFRHLIGPDRPPGSRCGGSEGGRGFPSTPLPAVPEPGPHPGGRVTWALGSGVLLHRR